MQPMLYTALLVLHSWLRWVVVFGGIAALGGAVGGLTTRRDWQPADHARALIFMIALDVQFLVGLVLYAGLSPVTWEAFGDMGAAMRNPILRFYAVEHAVAMIAALALVHIGRARIKKAADGRARHRTAVVFFGLGLLLMLLMIPWPGMTGGRVLFRGF
jgi:hypothetical protein